MKKFAKIILCLALVGAAVSLVMAPTSAQATWGDYTVTIIGAGYYSGYTDSTERNKQIYITFTYNAGTWTRWSRGDYADINQQLAVALTALTTGGTAQVQFDDATGTEAAGYFGRIVAGSTD